MATTTAMISQSSIESNIRASPGDHPGVGDIPFVWENRTDKHDSYYEQIKRSRNQDRFVTHADGAVHREFGQRGESEGAPLHREGRRQDTGPSCGPLQPPGGRGG